MTNCLRHSTLSEVQTLDGFACTFEQQQQFTIQEATINFKKEVSVEWVQQNVSITLENVAYREN